MYTLGYKEMAKEQMKGNMHTLIGGWLLYFLIYGILEKPMTMALERTPIPFPEESIAYFVFDYFLWVIGLLPLIFVTGALGQGVNSIHLKLTNGYNVEMADLFSQMSSFVGAGVLFVLASFLISIATFLFLVPGIIVFYAICMAPFVYLENPYDSPFHAIAESARIMKGHKMDLFKLHLNFLLWHVLGIFTFGLAYIYVYPYISQAEANFYNDIK